MAKKIVGEGIVKKLEVVLEGFFLGKMPKLPQKAKELIVKIVPWLVVAALILSVRPMLMSGYILGHGYYYGYGIFWLISIASMVLMAFALPGLFKQKMSAWKLMFYSGLVMAVYYLLTVNLTSLIIGTGVSMYLLFQIKSFYK